MYTDYKHVMTRLGKVFKPGNKSNIIDATVTFRPHQGPKIRMLGIKRIKAGQRTGGKYFYIRRENKVSSQSLDKSGAIK